MDDLISRQAAIDALDKRFDSIPMEQTTEILLLRKDLRNLPSADVPHWIPCSERLPIIENNNRARVLITTSWGFVKEAYYCVDHWKINDINFILTSVIAWMPLPEPYEERRER